MLRSRKSHRADYRDERPQRSAGQRASVVCTARRRRRRRSSRALADPSPRDRSKTATAALGIVVGGVVKKNKKKKARKDRTGRKSNKEEGL